jgi:zinc transport system ATP-binding protein
MDDNFILKVNGVDLGYGSLRVLDSVEFFQKRGEVAALLGPNGAGKSTLLKAILGDIKPIRGSIEIRDGLKIGYVPQVDNDGSRWPLSVRDFLGLFCRNCGEDKIYTALEEVGIIDLADKRLTDLSGGQHRKVLLAKALVNSPDFLILDEPTQEMDIASEADYIELINSFNRRGVSILIVTHILSVALKTAKRFLIFHNRKTYFTDFDGIMSGKVLHSVYGRDFSSAVVGDIPVVTCKGGAL